MKIDDAIKTIVKGIKQACGHPIVGMVRADELDKAQATLIKHIKSGNDLESTPFTALHGYGTPRDELFD